MQYDWLKKSISRLDDIRLLSGDFESFEKAKKERKIRIRLLLKSADKADHNVARILKKCKKGNRCGKGVCPVCARRFRIWFFAELKKIFPDAKKVKFITLIFTDQLAGAADLLSGVDVLKCINRLKQRARRAGLDNTVIMGGFEVDFNEETQRWEPHVHIIAYDPNEQSLQRLRDLYYRKTDDIERPMKIQPVRDQIKQYSYCLKFWCALKTFYIDSNGKKCGKKNRLGIEQHNLSMRFLAQYKIQDMVFIMGARRYGNELRVYSAK